MNKELIEKIKSRGYWRINFQPTTPESKLKLGECKDLIEKNNVELRGWNYPHYPRRIGDDVGLEPGKNFYEGWIDWWNHTEFWRMFESGQFLHYLALREDWFEKSGWGVPNEELKIKPMTVLGIIGSVVYQVTEIYEFLSRIGESGIYDKGVLVTITLNNTVNRKLWIEDDMRAGFFQDYNTSASEIEFVKKYTKEEILTKPKDLAMEAILFIFDHFGWHNPPIDTLKQDQEKLLTRRI